MDRQNANTEKENAAESSSPFQDKLCPRCGGTGICRECGGTGKTVCLNCGGKGISGISKSGKEIICHICKGEKTVPCDTKCPSCAGEGKITRSYQEAILKKYVKTQRKTSSRWASKLIFALCISVFILQIILPPPLNLIFGGLFIPYSPRQNPFEIWRLLTASLAHGGIFHILCNMYCLKIISEELEDYIGSLQFLLIFIFGAAFGGLISSLLNPIGGIGASAGLFALCAAYSALNKKYGIGSRNNAKSFFASLIIIIILGFVMQAAGYGTLDNFAHLGGMAAGIIWGTAVYRPKK